MKQQQLAGVLIQCLVIGSIAALTLKGLYLSDKMPATDLDASGPKRAKDLTAPSRFEPVLAAILAYGYYLVAALLANARFPQYLREHLFDGLAPAALVGFLVGLFPSNSDAPKAFPRIRRPITVAFLFGLGGTLVFGLIAAAGRLQYRDQ